MQDDSQNQTPWQYNPEGSTVAGSEAASTVNGGVPLPKIPEVSWTASEYIAHEKSISWYLSLAGVTMLLAAIVYVVTRDLVTFGAVLIASIALLVYSGRKPQTKHYTLNESGVLVGDRQYAYAAFRSFSVVEEEAIHSIWLKPLKRFAPVVVMYFAPDDEQTIVNTLANFLPHEDRQLDAIDRFSKRIRF